MKKAKNIEKTRSQEIIKSGYLFIAINFFLAIFNFLVGFISNSIAISSDAAHSLIDSISGFLVIITEKLAGHKKLTHQREKIERVATIAIAIIIILAGVHILHEAIEKIVEAESEPEYTLSTMIVLVASLALKYLLASYLKKTGREIKSTVVSASGAETMNDCLISVAVLISAIIYLIWQVDIEAYLSIAIALIIFKIGLEFIFPHLSKHHHHHLEQDPDHDHCRKK